MINVCVSILLIASGITALVTSAQVHNEIRPATNNLMRYSGFFLTAIGLVALVAVLFPLYADAFATALGL